MARQKAPINPLYVLVVLLGIVFAVTSFAYGTMAYRAIAPAANLQESPGGLMSFLDRYGVQALIAELTALGVATLGAMWLDQVQVSAESPTEIRNPGLKKRRIIIALVISFSLLPVLILGIWLLGELGGGRGD